MLYRWELGTFLAVADAGSFAKGAKIQHCSAVSAMNQVNAIERQVGVTLLERTHQGVHLTEAGRAVYNDARELMHLSDKIESHAKEIAKREQSTIRVGTSLLRPCKPLMDMWAQIGKAGEAFQISIEPFNDDPNSMKAMLDILGQGIDCFVGPCDSVEWQKNFNIFKLGEYRCEIALSRKHPLASKRVLRWSDLNGESLMLVERGHSPILDAIRTDIEQNHPKISILNVPNFYDATSFNDCVKRGCLMETLAPWRDMHPALVSRPVNWNYSMPYGIVYSKNSRSAMTKFIEMLEAKRHTTK